MGIDDKATYGEYYWAMQVEAQALYNENAEDYLAGHFRGLLSDIVAIEKLDPAIKSFLMDFMEPHDQVMGAVGLRFASEIGDMIAGQALGPYARIAKQGLEAKVLSNILTPAEATTLNRRKKITPELFDTYMRFGGYNDLEQASYSKAIEPYPSIPDLILYSRYHGDTNNVWGTLQQFYDIEPLDFKFWDWLGQQRLTTIEVQTLYKRGLFDERIFDNELAKIGWGTENRAAIEDLSWTIPNAMLLIQGNLHREVDRERMIEDISVADIHPKYAETYLDAILTKPASQDIIAYELRKDPDLSELNRKLQKIGIHPEYTELYKELAYQIPPVADIITMAVREAFTPEIAQRFGQYEDFPKEFEEWAGRKGLSKDWAERYWAAHWSLPSATQGFEMLHRGVITRSELDMLLRALDIMPFWREKLTGIAFRRLSRVDIRRMYGLGVLTEQEVLEAYTELGYNDRDAKRMANFTVKQILATQSKFTSRDVISAYSKYMIDKSEARSLLLNVGVKSENISFIISTADYKRSWELTESKISAIRNLYKKGVYDADKARGELLKLDMPAERVNVLMEQWFVDEKDKPPRRWTTAQTLGFIESGLITAERGRLELANIGYDTEHIDVYMNGA